MDKETILYWSPLPFNSLSKVRMTTLLPEDTQSYYSKAEPDPLFAKLNMIPESTLLIDLWPIFLQNVSFSQWLWSFINHAPKKHRYLFLVPKPLAHLSIKEDIAEVYSVYSLLLNSKLEYMCLVTAPPHEHLKNVIQFSHAEFNRSNWLQFAPWSLLKNKTSSVSNINGISHHLSEGFKSGFFLLDEEVEVSLTLPKSSKFTFPCLFKDFFPRKINSKKMKALIAS